MSKKPLILGIETSCDETAASIITENELGNPVVLSNIVSSQVEVHKKFGGVVPELAARSHIEKIDWIVQKAIKDSGRTIKEIDAVASTAGPGLIVCLSVGLSFGKAFAASLDKPFIAVNHLEGHALSPKINSTLNYPYLVLLISGGHSQFLNVQGLGKYKRLGTTIDDALGEAFDKTAKMLDLGYPGGPSVEKFAKLGDKDFFKLPEPIINRAGCNLSFAGLKTAVLRESKKINGETKLKYNLAASFQNTINKILYKKTKVAVNMFREKTKKENFQLIVAGGVAANESIRINLYDLSKEMGFKTVYPDLKFCGDNAAMIAWAGIQRFKKNLIDNVDVSAKSRWPLDKDAPYMKGPGLKL